MEIAHRARGRAGNNLNLYLGINARPMRVGGLNSVALQ